MFRLSKKKKTKLTNRIDSVTLYEAPNIQRVYEKESQERFPR